LLHRVEILRFAGEKIQIADDRAKTRVIVPSLLVGVDECLVLSAVPLEARGLAAVWDDAFGHADADIRIKYIDGDAVLPDAEKIKALRLAAN
jgi:hypothetical protein